MPKYKVLQSSERSTQPAGGPAALPPVETFGHDLNGSSGTGCLLFLIWILTLDLKCLPRSVTLTCIVLLPAGEITVPVSNKIEGTRFQSVARFSDSSSF